METESTSSVSYQASFPRALYMFAFAVTYGLAAMSYGMYDQNAYTYIMYVPAVILVVGFVVVPELRFMVGVNTTLDIFTVTVPAMLYFVDAPALVAQVTLWTLFGFWAISLLLNRMKSSDYQPPEDFLEDSSFTPESRNVTRETIEHFRNMEPEQVKKLTSGMYQHRVKFRKMDWQKILVSGKPLRGHETVIFVAVNLAREMVQNEQVDKDRRERLTLEITSLLQTNLQQAVANASDPEPEPEGEPIEPESQDKPSEPERQSERTEPEPEPEPDSEPAEVETVNPENRERSTDAEPESDVKDETTGPDGS